MSTEKPAMGVNRTVTRLVLSVLVCAWPMAHGSSQSKPPIDSAVIKQWSYVNMPIISSDGKYFSYTVSRWYSNGPADSSTLVVQSTVKAWKKEFPGASAGLFAGDSRRFVFLAKDTLCFLALPANHPDCISGVRATGSRE